MNKNTFKLAIVAFGFSLFFSISACAQSKKRGQRGQEKTPPTFEQLIKDMDADENGKLSKDEIKGPLKDDFDKVDANEDGFITEEEFENAPKPERRERRNK